MKTSRALMAAVLLLASTMALPASPITVGGGWQIFTWTGLGAITEGQYTFDVTPYPGGLRLRVVDCCVIGDRFRLTLNPGALVFDSSDPSAWDGIASPGVGGDAAWADARLSRKELTPLGGPYTLDINVIRLALGTTSGGGFIRLDDPNAVVPEPATFGIVGAALLGLAFLRRRLAR